MSTATHSYTLSDTQGETDDRAIAINNVGIRSLKLPLRILKRDRSVLQVTADFDLSVNLAPDRRGAHMSRFPEIANSYSKRPFSLDHLPDLLRDIRDDLGSSHVDARISFDYFVEKAPPLRELRGLMDVRCERGGRLRDGVPRCWIGASVPLTTLCPCSKTNSNHGAHNQRAFVTVRAVSGERIWLDELIERIEAGGSSPLYPILKREDEAYVTDQAYQNPRFVEDVVRDLHADFESDPRIDDYVIECMSFESIHSHNAYARISRGTVESELSFGSGLKTSSSPT